MGVAAFLELLGVRGLLPPLALPGRPKSCMTTSMTIHMSHTLKVHWLLVECTLWGVALALPVLMGGRGRCAGLGKLSAVWPLPGCLRFLGLEDVPCIDSACQ